MEFFIYLFKRALKSTIITIILIVALWITLYELTDFDTVKNYFWTGLAVCAANTMIANLRKHRIENLLQIQGVWIIMAGVVLVLYHAGFVAAAVFTAASFFALPFFGATVYEGIVGLTLLITLARMI